MLVDAPLALIDLVVRLKWNLMEWCPTLSPRSISFPAGPSSEIGDGCHRSLKGRLSTYMQNMAR